MEIDLRIEARNAGVDKKGKLVPDARAMAVATCRCLNLTLSGPRTMSAIWSLSGEKRTSGKPYAPSFDSEPLCGTRDLECDL